MKAGKSFPKRFCLVFSLLAAWLAFPLGLPIGRLYEPLERLWHDASFELRANRLPTGDNRLILIAVDDRSVQKLGFPLPRKHYASAVDRLRELGVKTVVFDVLFLEPREGDPELSAAMKRHGNVVNLFLASLGKDNKPEVQRTVGPIAKASKILASPAIDRHVEPDGHVRTFALFDPSIDDPYRPGTPLLSLAAASLMAHEGADREALVRLLPTDEGFLPLLNYRRPRTWPLPVDSAGVGIWVPPYLHVSIEDVVSGKLSPEVKKALKGSLAMIASTSIGYYDHYPTPFTKSGPGAEHHLNVIDNVINRDPLQAPNHLLDLVAVLVFAWVPYALLAFLTPATAAAATLGALGALVAFSLWSLGSGSVFHPVAPGLALVVSFLVLTVHRVLTEGAEKKMIKGMFGQFVAPDIVEELANNPEKAKLGAQKRNMTVFFLDIAHFTTISEKMGPEALMAFLNKYLSALSHEVLERKGTIDKYIGDCIMAFWNAPNEVKDHHSAAVLAALECQKVIEKLNKDLDPGLPEIPAIRIGVNSGDMNVGFTGTDRKLQYTVIGDEVNLASRLEGANKFFGSKIIISQQTYDGAKDVCEARYLGRARVVGKDTPIPVYEPLAKKGELNGKWGEAFPLWEKAVKAFYDKRYEEALPMFERFMQLLPDDGPGDVYLKMARDYAALPPDDWDQVFNLTAK